MQAGTGKNRARSAPFGLLGMIACIAVVELFLTRGEVDLLQPIQLQWRFQSRASRRKDVPKDEVLCFGDSLVSYGVVPPILEERLGRRTFNYAVGGGQFPSNYFFLRRALESGAHPSALVIDVLPRQLNISPWVEIRLWSDALSVRETIEMAWAARDSGFLASVMIAKRLTSYQSRFEIRQSILAALGGLSLSQRTLNVAIRRNLTVNHGALIQMPRQAIQFLPDHQGWVYPDAVKVDRMNGFYLRKFLELAAERGIPVFWVLTPVSALVQSRAAEARTIEPNEQFLRRVLDRYSGVTIVDGRRSGYPDTALDDSIHLARSGAAVFSADLADAMARVLDGGRSAGPRWVALPAFRERPIAARFEDLGESATASAKAASVLK